jgi:ankyrin repeat protein
MGHLDVLRVLLDRGAMPNLDAEGHTPRSLAEGRKNGDIVAVLDKYIAALCSGSALVQPNSAGIKLPPNIPRGTNVEAVGCTRQKRRTLLPHFGE